MRRDLIKRILLLGILCLALGAPGGRAAWNLQTADWEETLWYSVGMYSSLALDSAGRPHISYYGQNNGGLKYAFSTDGYRWAARNISSPDINDEGRYTSLALDSAGGVHISFQLG
jgi:hypothetical protein